MSECFRRDVTTRNAWVPLVSPKVTAQLGAIERKARLALYKEVDKNVGIAYNAILNKANEDVEVVLIKGLGLTRQSKTQLNLDVVLAEAAQIVVTEMFGAW